MSFACSIAAARLDALLPAVTLPLRRRRADRDGRGLDLSGTAAVAVSAVGRRDQPPRSRQHADRGDPDLPDNAGAVLRLAADRLFQNRAEGARRSGAD